MRICFNVDTIAFLTLHCGIDEAIYFTCKNSIASIEDINLNFYDEKICYTTRPMTEVCAVSYFNNDAKAHKQEINAHIRYLLENNNKRNHDENVTCRQVLFIVGKSMIKDRFYSFYSTPNRLIMCTRLKAIIIAKCQNEFFQKWDHRVKKENYLNKKFADLFYSIKAEIKSIDIKKYLKTKNIK